MAEKHEYAGSGTRKNIGIYLALCILGVIVIGFGMVTGFNVIVVGLGVLCIGVGLGMWMLASGTRELTMTDISIKFMKGERVIFEAVWGEIERVRFGKREQDEALTLRFDFQGGRNVMITGAEDFPDEVIEDIFYKIRNIKEKYRYRRLEVEKGKVEGF